MLGACTNAAWISNKLYTVTNQIYWFLLRRSLISWEERLGWMICKMTRAGLPPVQLGALWVVSGTNSLSLTPQALRRWILMDDKWLYKLMLKMYPSCSWACSDRQVEAQILQNWGNNFKSSPCRHKKQPSSPHFSRDMNATLYDDNRSSCLRYKADVMCREFVAEIVTIRYQTQRNTRT